MDLKDNKTFGAVERKSSSLNIEAKINEENNDKEGNYKYK